MSRAHRPPSDIERRQFDLIVIGGGINGVAIARDAAMRGLDVVLLDQSDIGSGTTSWSTRLIHGGLRYLEHAEIKLVRESLRERERLLRNAPHLVRPLPLAIPVYRGARRGPLTIRAGMVLYDFLSFDKSLPRHRMLSRLDALNRFPGLKPDGLQAAAVYYDAQATFAERLAIENALSARAHGAVLLIYTRVDRICAEGAVVTGVEATDVLTGDRLELRGRIVVNAAGPWVDSVLAGAPVPTKRMIGGTKGSHLVVPSFPGAPQDAIYFEAQSDGRPVFIIPWNGAYLIGSTDIRVNGDPGAVQADDNEINYLLSEANAIIPGAGLSTDDIWYVYCGVCPLPYQPSGAEGAITRRHLVHDHAPQLRGLFSIIGGKLTTHRSLAEEAVNIVCDRLGKQARCPTAHAPLPGYAGISLEPFRRTLQQETGLSETQASRLVSIYGERAREVIAYGKDAPELLQPIAPQTDVIGAEIVHAVQREFAETLGDILMRRTMASLAPDMAIGVDEAAAAIAGRSLGWSEERVRKEVADYRASLRRFRPKALAEVTTPAS